MKNLIAFLSIAVTLVAVTASADIRIGVKPRAPKWVEPSVKFDAYKLFLGETMLENRADGDFIKVRGGQECGLTHFKIGVRGDGAVIKDLRVVFGNGDVQDISVRERFQPGTDSRWVDLQGDKRCITGVFVFGHSFSRTPRMSKVIFFGLKQKDYDQDPRRVLLGRVVLANGPDSDVVDLRRPVCGLTNFKIIVRGDDATVNFVGLQFGNGSFQQIPVRSFFRKDSGSEWKDLKGDARCIDKIFISGRSSSRPRASTVELWGIGNW